jgi:hypothetical protein
MTGRLNDEMLRELGRIAVSASEVEFQAASLAHLLLGENVDVGLAVTAGMSFDPLFRLIDDLVLLRLDPAGRAARLFSGARTYVQAAMKGRNDLLHGHWVFLDGQDAMGLANSKRSDPLRIRTDVTYAELRRVSDELHASVAMLRIVWVDAARERGMVADLSPGSVARGEGWLLTARELERHDSKLLELRKGRQPPLQLRVTVSDSPSSGEREVSIQYGDE